jgi:ADP-heptose:LPS heptosyltransferase/GT2 family glycosyltransferase
MFFKDYDLLAQSGLFDAKFYKESYPDVSATNADPLAHYLEFGASEGRNPRPDFDARYYLEQCQRFGESPANPLVHFITTGAKRGLKTQRPLDRLLHIESPVIRMGVVEAPVSSSLTINGWALTGVGIESVNVAIDGMHAAVAQHSIRRVDVAEAYPDRADALQSGFATLIPQRLLSNGPHTVTLTIRDKSANLITTDFRIEVQDIPESEGPWSLRNRVSLAEVDLHLRMLSRLKWQPEFLVLLRTGVDTESVQQARRTLASLRNQVYPHWRVAVLSTKGELDRSVRKQLLSEFDEIADRIEFPASRHHGSVAKLSRTQRAPIWISPVACGDELGVDALIELAMASGQDRDADFLYSDERCISPVSAKVDAYFKPQWSPDLLLSTNYIGRLWAAESQLFERSRATPAEWLTQGDYDLVLRITEAAKRILHVPKVLCSRAGKASDSPQAERQALARCIARRGIKGKIEKGCAPGIHRLKRKTSARSKVSIIIPTMAARGLIKTCIESLRDKTSYPNYELICIQNIPSDQAHWKQWLERNADHVIEANEPFNWSSYNNLAVKKASGNMLLFLNDDIEVIEPDWLDVLLEHAERPEVGAVGPQLLYPDRTVQHAGVVLSDTLGIARHLFRHAQEDDPGYFGLALTQRNVIGVTGACLLTRRETFEALGGFDEAHTIVNNDLDYCLRCWERGLLNVFTPHTRLIHHELASRAELGDAYDRGSFGTQWRKVFLDGDPYLNPNHSREYDHFTAEREPIKLVFASKPLMARASVLNILVVKLDHIGDCVTALPAIRRLKRHFPHARIDVLSSTVTRPIWEGESAIHKIHEFDFFHARSGLGKKQVSEQELILLQRRLQETRYDLAVDFRKSPDVRHILKYTGAKLLAGFDHDNAFPWLDIALEWEGDRAYTAKRQHVGNDLVNLADAIAASCDGEDQFMHADPKVRLSLSAAEQRRIFAKPVVAVHPFSGNELRRWPPGRFAELIDMLASEMAVNIVLVGGADEAVPAGALLGLIRQPEAVFDLVGKLSLSELPRLLLRCAVFIGNNSGIHHIAAALGVPTVGIHSGVVDAREWGALGPSSVAIRRDVLCSPCYIEFADSCPRKLACLTTLGPGDVFKLCTKMMALGKGASLVGQGPSRRL